MPEYNNIRDIIKKLYNSLKDLIKNNGIFSFINLAALNFTIMILIILVTEWINSNMNIFNFSIPMISLRLALSSLFIGIWIGFFKITLNYLDGNKINILNITSNFDLLPKILVLKLPLNYDLDSIIKELDATIFKYKIKKMYILIIEF